MGVDAGAGVEWDGGMARSGRIMVKGKGRPARVGVRARRSGRFVVALVGGAVLALLPLLVMRLGNVPLGEVDRFVYRYSPIWGARLITVVTILPLVGIAAAALYLLGQVVTWKRLAGGVVLGVAVVSLVAWDWLAPPQAVVQHDLNYRSPSHEGAFVVEAEQVESIGEYLRGFDRRIERSPVEMRGTRVLSNTPGLTVMLAWIEKTWPVDPERPGWLGRRLVTPGALPAEHYIELVNSIRASLLMAGMWALSAVFAYLLGRLFFSPLGAGAFCLLVTFNPMTLHFSPGKDAGQLLTISAMLWLWFLGYRKRSGGLAGLSGAILVLGMGWGMIHLWVAVAALGATILREWTGKGDCPPDGFQGTVPFSGPRLWRGVLGAAVGGLGVVVAVYLAVGWNMIATFWAVTRRYGQVQETIVLDRRLWVFIGLPIFLMFLSPGFWNFVLLGVRRWRRRRPSPYPLPAYRERGKESDLRAAGDVVRGAHPTLPGVGRGAQRRWGRGWGVALGVCTSIVMGITYVLGVTYELPRLWIAFLPLVMLAGMVNRPLLRVKNSRRAVVPVLWIVCISLVASAVHWSVLDVRESEFRLTSQRFFR